MARKLSGIVTSDVQDKTIVVTVTTRKTHPIYGKSYLVNTKFAAHDEKNEAKKGDSVIIAESKPISKKKRFVLESITTHGHEAVEIKKSSVEEEIEAKLAEKKAKKESKDENRETSEAENLDSRHATHDSEPTKETQK
jgi:small subunit ribosomal protein S17